MVSYSIHSGVADVGAKSHTKFTTEVESLHELYQAVKDIGDWKGLCLNLKVNDAKMNSLDFSPKPIEWKKLECLKAYFDTGEATWEDVVRAVREHPIYNNRVAKQIAKRYLHKDTKDEL